jgi:hypothetical protein
MGLFCLKEWSPRHADENLALNTCQDGASAAGSLTS